MHARSVCRGPTANHSAVQGRQSTLSGSVQQAQTPISIANALVPCAGPRKCSQYPQSKSLLYDGIMVYALQFLFFPCPTSGSVINDDTNFYRYGSDNKEELAKRVSIFAIASSLASMFSGYLMSAVIGLDGRHGIKGWQW